MRAGGRPHRVQSADLRQVRIDFLIVVLHTLGTIALQTAPRQANLNAMLEGAMTPNRQELEDEWRTRVADAKLELDMARGCLVEVQRDLKNGLISSSDGDFAYQHALRAETR